MKKDLLKHFDDLEAKRDQLIKLVQNIPDSRLLQQPAEGKWSVFETMAHVMAAEEMSLLYLRKKIQSTKLEKPEGLKQKWNWLLVKLVFLFDIKFKAPDIVLPKKEYNNLMVIDKRWTVVRSQIREVIEQLSEEELEKTLWKHAIAGKLNLYHMVQFFEIHYDRHYRQIVDTLHKSS